MVKKKNVMAFDGNYNFYELLKDIPGLNAGAVFYWDKEDQELGSIAEGCLKLCWTPKGDCYGGKNNCGLCGNAIVFHASTRYETEWFELVKKAEEPVEDVPVEMTIKHIENLLGYKIKIISEENNDIP